MKRLSKIASEFGNDFAGFLNYAFGQTPFTPRHGGSWGIPVGDDDKHFFELWLDPENDGLGFFICAYRAGGGYSLKMEFIGINRTYPTQWVSTADHAVLILTSFVGTDAYETVKKEWAIMPEVQKSLFFTF